MTADRIDGWKEIGRHFGRDRSTVIRWAAERGLPVHAIPGGKTRTVYAFRGELDHWAQRLDEAIAPLALPETVAVPDGRQARRRRGAIVAAAAVMAALAGAAAWLALFRAPADARDALPQDPRVAAIFVAGRDDWARRTPASLAASVTLLQRVTTLDPGFAPAFADLADAYLLQREVGSLADADGFSRAGRAAARAEALAPGLPAADRALGFIAYWRDSDRVRAGRMFAGALARDPADAQTHFWFANILADNGQDAAAMQAFDRARLLDPGSRDIAADLAWANWSAGRDQTALAQLDAVVAADPANVEARDCRSIVRLAGGDYTGYLADREAWAALRATPALAADVAQQRAAWARGGAPALLAALITHARTTPDQAQLAFVAGLAADRETVATTLSAAARRGEQWGEAGYFRRIALRWRTDPVITAALRTLRPPPLG
ncbi:tetratricopeptide repeat protein [Sphingomonas sp.]|uniref:tetratricopeptide repeat protein n=1 Tax=Sphingomonas sp. TaxID=28214 RepID=UPI003CC62FC4